MIQIPILEYRSFSLDDTPRMVKEIDIRTGDRLGLEHEVLVLCLTLGA